MKSWIEIAVDTLGQRGYLRRALGTIGEMHNLPRKAARQTARRRKPAK